VIVYVEFTPSPQVALARTKLVTSTASVRFVRIGLRTALPPYDLIPLIAHELQHAIEIADCPDARDDGGVRRLFQRIGHQHGTDKFETEAAGDIERLVRQEIRDSRIRD
jgi:hypothetical protein